MDEFIVIVESSADAEIATKLAERILVEKVDWLEPEYLQYSFSWCGLQENTAHSCWKDLTDVEKAFKREGYYTPRFINTKNTNGAGKYGEPLKPDAARAIFLTWCGFCKEHERLKRFCLSAI